MNKPVILHLITSLSLTGGTAAKVRTLAQYSQYKHIIFYSDVKVNASYIKEWEKISNCVLIKGLTRKNYIKDAINVCDIIKQYHPNIIHVYFPPDTITASIIKKLYPNVKLVRSFEGNVQQGLLKKFIIKQALRNFDQLIYISNYVKEFYQNKIPASMLDKGCIIFNAAARQSNTQLPLQHHAESQRLVSVSGLNPSKNLFVLIDAINLLIKRGMTAHLDILGDGPLKDKLQAKINQYRINKYVTLLGFCDKVIEYLDASSIYVHPANNEGFGIAVVEAMQRRCAIIVSDAGALPEIITDSVNGIIAQPYDSNDWANKIEILLNNQKLIDRLGENAYQTVNEKFSIKRYVDEHEKMYERLI